MIATNGILNVWMTDWLTELISYQKGEEQQQQQRTTGNAGTHTQDPTLFQSSQTGNNFHAWKRNVMESDWWSFL